MKTIMDEFSFEEGGAVVHIRKKSEVGPDAQRSTQVESGVFCKYISDLC